MATLNASGNEPCCSPRSESDLCVAYEVLENLINKRRRTPETSASGGNWIMEKSRIVGKKKNDSIAEATNLIGYDGDWDGPRAWSRGCPVGKTEES